MHSPPHYLKIMLIKGKCNLQDNLVSEVENPVKGRQGNDILKKCHLKIEVILRTSFKRRLRISNQSRPKYQYLELASPLDSPRGPPWGPSHVVNIGQKALLKLS